MPHTLAHASHSTFNCPITQQRMTDPLITPSGHSEDTPALLIYKFTSSIHIETDGKSIPREHPATDLDLFAIEEGAESCVSLTEHIATALLTPRGQHFIEPTDEEKYLRYQRQHVAKCAHFNDTALQNYTNITFKEISCTKEESVYDAASGTRIRHNLVSL